MATDPKYVRLTSRLARSILADVQGRSGWSISGYNVVPFPDSNENAAAVRFVRKNLASGKLEPASQAEYEEVQASNKKLAALVPDQEDKEPRQPLQESNLQQEARRLRRQHADRHRGGIAPEDIIESSVESDDEEVDLDDLNAQEIVSGIQDGSLDPEDVREYEEGRGKPRKTVLDALDAASE